MGKTLAPPFPTVCRCPHTNTRARVYYLCPSLAVCLSVCLKRWAKRVPHRSRQCALRTRARAQVSKGGQNAFPTLHDGVRSAHGRAPQSQKVSKTRSPPFTTVCAPHTGARPSLKRCPKRGRAPKSKSYGKTRSPPLKTVFAPHTIVRPHRNPRAKRVPHQ